MVQRVKPVYNDKDALAQAIKEARGAMSQQALGEWLGRDKKTVGRWEAGEEASLGDTIEKRRAIAILVAEATGRRDLLGLSEPEPGQIDLLREELAETRSAVGDGLGALTEETDGIRKALGHLTQRVEQLERGAGGGSL
jgi:DNA-binding XRE family transcriptional regulator